MNQSRIEYIIPRGYSLIKGIKSSIIIAIFLPMVVLTVRSFWPSTDETELVTMAIIGGVLGLVVLLAEIFLGHDVNVVFDETFFRCTTYPQDYYWKDAVGWALWLFRLDNTKEMGFVIVLKAPQHKDGYTRVQLPIPLDNAQKQKVYAFLEDKLGREDQGLKHASDIGLWTPAN